MKKYKHKETGAIVVHESVGKYIIENWGKLSPVDYSITLDFNFNSNDWEEVLVENTFSRDVFKSKEEPNYLITAFRELNIGTKFGNTIITLDKDGTFQGTFHLNELLHGPTSVEDGSFEIYSVKNSKGEEFTIGDKTNYGEILGFITNVNGDNTRMYVIVKEKSFRTDLDNLTIKIKSPIYTTTDGVEIMEGEKITLYLLNKDLTLPIIHEIPIFNGFSEQDNEVADRYLTFTSEENRDKYIKENTKKPIFVSADNVAFYDNDTDFGLFSVLPKANWQENRYRLNDIIKWPKKEWLHFHTKEARQEYIDTNKPKYSLADVFMASEKIPSGHLITTGMLDQLKKLGK